MVILAKLVTSNWFLKMHAIFYKSSCDFLTHRPTFFLNSSLCSLHSFCNNISMAKQSINLWTYSNVAEFHFDWRTLVHNERQREHSKKKNVGVTAASTFAGDSSLGLESIDIMLKTMLSTWKNITFWIWYAKNK